MQKSNAAPEAEIRTENYWTWTAETALQKLVSSTTGLPDEKVTERKKRYGPNRLSTTKKESALYLLWRQLSNPLIGILVFAAVVSAATKEWTEAIMVVVIILASALLGFVQEFRASKAIGLLLQRIAHTVTVRRNGQISEVPTVDVVPGDIVLLNAGTMIPADGILIQSKDLFANQAVLTGESMPAEKNVGTSPASASLSLQNNAVFAGTSIRSGVAEMIVVHTGMKTHLGQISDCLELREAETDFERGLKQFGYLLTRIMIVFVLAILVGNIWLQKPLIDSLLFSIALAVGLSPELLPAILTVTLAKGAVKMAKKGVIVRRLNCIESLGNMSVLCCDKTGTLTEGRVTLHSALDIASTSSNRVAELASCNAKLQTGIKNSLDDAILESQNAQAEMVTKAHKLDEIPYDFIRRRLTVVVSLDEKTLMISKGAVVEMLQTCRFVRDADFIRPLTERDTSEVLRKVNEWGSAGYRVLAVASREVHAQAAYSLQDEKEFTLEGFLLFQDPPRADAKRSLAELKNLGVETKIITGDNCYVAEAVARAVGFENPQILTGSQLNDLSSGALLNQVAATHIFAEVDPQQKETIILSLKKTNRVVGYLGDGINDAPALLAADVGISVESAVDVAKESADLVLTHHDLKTILAGVLEGRITFANTLKYIFITTSANFGNMVSMALASLFLPFLPLLATQILLNNLLSDIPALAIGTDSVDQDWRKTPHRWDIKSVRKFMLGFGMISSFFDILTFAVLLMVFHATVSEFQTGWFCESLLTEILIIFVVRTSRPLWKSRPSRVLVLSSLVVVAVSILIVATPLRNYFGFAPLSWTMVGGIVLISILCTAVSELAKSRILLSRG